MTDRDHTARVNLHMYPTTFKHESRILRITGSLAEAGTFDEIHILAYWEPGLAKVESLDPVRQVWRMRSWLGDRCKGVLKIIQFYEWAARSLWRFRNKNVVCVNPHSVSALPMAIVFKIFKGAKVIYDTHELETETTEAIGLRKLVGQLSERWLIPWVDAVVVTSDGYGAWYQKQYGLKDVWVIKNFPLRGARPRQQEPILKLHFGIPENETLFIYQGYLSRGRGIHILLEVFCDTTPDKHIVFMGFGDLTSRVQEYARKYSNIHFHAGVKPLEVVKYVSGADVGVSLIERICLSYYHTLPNKVLESLSAGVPIVVSDFPDMSALVEQHGCGWKVSVDKLAVAKLVARLSKAEIESKRTAALTWAREHVWEREERTLLKLYGTLLHR